MSNTAPTPTLLTEGYEQALRLIDEMFERGELTVREARQAEAEAARRFGKEGA